MTQTPHHPTKLTGAAGDITLIFSLLQNWDGERRDSHTRFHSNHLLSFVSRSGLSLDLSLFSHRLRLVYTLSLLYFFYLRSRRPLRRQHLKPTSRKTLTAATGAAQGQFPECCSPLALI